MLHGGETENREAIRFAGVRILVRKAAPPRRGTVDRILIGSEIIRPFNRHRIAILISATAG